MRQTAPPLERNFSYVSNFIHAKVAYFFYQSSFRIFHQFPRFPNRSGVKVSYFIAALSTLYRYLPIAIAKNNRIFCHFHDPCYICNTCAVIAIVLSFKLNVICKDMADFERLNDINQRIWEHGFTSGNLNDLETLS